MGRGTFVPLQFGPGEAFQFDWSGDRAVIGRVRASLSARMRTRPCYALDFSEIEINWEK